LLKDMGSILCPC